LNVRCDEAGDNLQGTNLVADWVTVYARVSQQAVEQPKAFVFEEYGSKAVTFPLHVQRLEDRDGRRAFSVRAERRDGNYESTVVFDPDGIPHSFTTKLQQGTVILRRLK